MRLRPRQEIDRLKAQERKRDIDEGEKLARNIDALRQIRTREERELEAFRTNRLNAAQEAVQAAFKRKDELEAQIGVLEKECERLRVPLDEEWEEVRKKRDANILADQRNEERELSLREDRRRIEAEKRALFVREERAAARERLADGKFAQAGEKLLDAERTILSARDLKSSAEAWQKEAVAGIGLRESGASLRESSIREKEEKLQAKGKELDEREANLIFRFSVLERTEKSRR